MGSNYNYYKNAVSEWGSKARKFRSEKSKTDNLIKEEIMSQLDQYRGVQTGIYTDKFGLEFPLFENSTIYYVTNVGKQREQILNYLKSKQIDILEEESMFKYIMIGGVELGLNKCLELELKEQFNCGLLWDGVM